MENDLPKRKPNRLKGYDYSKNGLYFVTICVKDRHEILWKRRNDIVGGDAHIAPSPLTTNMSYDEYTRYLYGQKINLSDEGKTVKRYLETIPGIIQYVIMPNHLHLIISIEDNAQMRGDVGIAPYRKKQPLSQRIKSFKILVTKELGYSIFQRSYYDRIIRNEKEHRAISEYIRQNPLRWEQDILNPKNQTAEEIISGMNITNEV